jgi:hypothetical protein
MGVPPIVIPPPQAAVVTPQKPETGFESAVAFMTEHAEILVSLIFVFSLGIWLLFIPTPEKPYALVDAKAGAPVVQGNSAAAASSRASQEDLDVWDRYGQDYAHFK